jgi:hypothetical protein
MSETSTYEAYVDAAAAALDLPLSPAHRPGVLRYFALAAEMAALVNGLPLAVHDEAAEAFVPIGPDDLEAG